VQLPLTRVCSIR